MTPSAEIIPLFYELFDIIREDVVTQIHKNIKEYSVRGDVTNLFRVTKWRDFVNTKIKPIYSKYLSRAKTESAISVINDAANRYATEVAKTAAQSVTKVSTINELVNIIKNMPELNRELVWADTEGAALDEAAALRSTNAKFKTWITAEDERVRETVHANHVRMHGVKLPVNHKFQLISGLADAPRDFSLAPQDRINCRCVLVYSDR